MGHSIVFFSPCRVCGTPIGMRTSQSPGMLMAIHRCAGGYSSALQEPYVGPMPADPRPRIDHLLDHSIGKPHPSHSSSYARKQDSPGGRWRHDNHVPGTGDYLDGAAYALPISSPARSCARSRRWPDRRSLLLSMVVHRPSAALAWPRLTPPVGVARYVPTSRMETPGARAYRALELAAHGADCFNGEDGGRHFDR